MRIDCVNVYQFEELSDEAKEVARTWYRGDGVEPFDYLIEEAWESAKAFAKAFDIDLRSIDFTYHEQAEYRISDEHGALPMYDEDPMTGVRLATYIWNNYKSVMYTGIYKKSWETDKPVRHRKVKSQLMSKETGWTNKDLFGKYWNQYYSATKLECSCPFTGVYYDDVLLKPIIDFMNNPGKHTDFKDLISDCFDSLIKSVNEEIRYQNSDEAVDDTIIANEYEFTIDGERY